MIDELEPRSELAQIRMEPLRESATKANANDNPPGYGMAFGFTLLSPPIGIIAGIVWLCSERYSSQGGQLLLVSLVLCFIYALLLPLLF